jgi:O-antigen/teichoic acid export membrane protein
LAKRLFAESWPLILSGIAITIYGRIDVVMLRYFVGEGEVGQYSAAVRLSEISYLLPVLLASTFFPALVEAQEKSIDMFRRRAQRFLDLNALFAFLGASVLSGGATWWISIAYGEAYAPARPILALHAWSAVFVYLGVARSHVLTAEKKTMIQLISTGVGGLANVALNAWLIPRVGAMGAVWATIVAQAAAAWLVLVLSSGSRWVFYQVTVSVLLPITGFRYLRSTYTRRNH